MGDFDLSDRSQNRRRFAATFVVRPFVNSIDDLRSESIAESSALYFLAAFSKSLRAALAFDGETIATKE